jgi:hypothetical protein
VYGVTDADHASEAKTAGREALAEFGLDGTVRLVAPSSDGATVRDPQ